MSGIAITSAGTKIYIALGLPSAFTAIGFAALDWNEIAEVDDLGEFGKEFSVIKRTPLASRRVRKLKGSYDQGALPIKLARVPSDGGQADCIAALEDDGAQSFYVELSDGTKIYFEALVMSFKTGIGGAESFTSASIGLELDSDTIEVAPG